MNLQFNKENYIEVDFPDIDYSRWRSYNQIGQYDCPYAMFKHFMNQCDCTKEYKSGRPMMTNYPIYKLRLSEAYYWISKIQNQFIYNEAIEYMINCHNNNLIFEHEHPYIKTDIKTTSNNIKNKTSNNWIKQNTKDLFTNKDKYIYQNIVTGESYISDNDNELEILNKPKVKLKIKRDKVKTIPLESMTFSFKNR